LIIFSWQIQQQDPEARKKHKMLIGSTNYADRLALFNKRATISGKKISSKDYWHFKDGNIAV
jgi:hypothetical protein